MSVNRIRVVLVRPKTSGNVGAVARALANFGLSDLALVAPRGYRTAAAAKTAVHARAVLDGRTKFRTLAEAVADCAWVVGTTCRPGSYRRRTQTPREIAPEIVAVAQTKRVALVLGPEDHGLSNDELKICNELVTIPTHSTYASLNLSHAATVCLYELFVARHTSRAPEPALASSASLERMYADLGRALLAIGFLHGANPEHIMFSIRRLFGRARLDEREVAIWLGVARQIEWFAAGGREIAVEKKRRGERLK